MKVLPYNGGNGRCDTEDNKAKNTEHHNDCGGSKMSVSKSVKKSVGGK